MRVLTGIRYRLGSGTIWMLSVCVDREQEGLASVGITIWTMGADWPYTWRCSDGVCTFPMREGLCPRRHRRTRIRISSCTHAHLKSHTPFFRHHRLRSPLDIAVHAGSLTPTWHTGSIQISPLGSLSTTTTASTIIVPSRFRDYRTTLRIPMCTSCPGAKWASLR